MSDAALLGQIAVDWLRLGGERPPGLVRLILTDVDGVITRGEGQPADASVMQRIAAINAAARDDPYVPALTLCTGRQAPYVELLVQLLDVFLPCIFEHGAGLFLPGPYRFDFDPRLGPDYAARLGRLRAALDAPLLRSGRAFVQPGKEASMSLYPLGTTSLDELFETSQVLVAQSAPEFSVARNVHGVEVRPRGIDKGTGAQRVARLLDVPLAAMAGVGDSDPDLSYLNLVGFSAAPANATPAVLAAVDAVADAPFGDGLLEVVTRVERRNRQAGLTKT